MPASSPAQPVLRSFRFQTALLFGSLAVLLCSVLAFTLGNMLQSESRGDKGRSLEVMAEVAARTLGDGMSLRLRETRLLAGAQDLWADGLASPVAAQALARARVLTPHSAWIGVASLDGKVQLATDDLLLGQNVASRPWFEKGLLGGHVSDVHPAKLLAKLLPAPASGEPLRFVDFAAPIIVDGAVLGVLGVHGTWDWARDVVESLLPEDASRRSLAFFIFDRSGEVLYAPSGASPSSAQGREKLPRLRAVLEGDAEGHAGGDHRSAVGLATWVDGQEYLTAIMPVQPGEATANLGWTVVVREPAALAFAQARAIGRRAVLLGLLVSMAAGTAAWVLSGYLSRPLAEVARAAQAVERGMPGAAIPVLEQNNELQRLSSALAGMTDRLQSVNESLEERVRLRTEELHHANQELARANAELSAMARHDPLTGLPNRRAFDEAFERALSLSRRTGSPVSLLAMDADRFKSVNDRFGHAVGDLALQAIARALTTRLRETDVVARLGGEEFVAILPATDAEGARRIADDLRQRVEMAEVPELGHITISIGVANTPAGDESAAGLLRRADEALYQAKAQGRNRVCVAAPLPREVVEAQAAAEPVEG